MTTNREETHTDANGIEWYNESGARFGPRV